MTTTWKTANGGVYTFEDKDKPMKEPFARKLASRARRLMDVPRWNIVPVLRKQNVAEHSFHVAWITMILTSRHARRQNLNEALAYAITHDVNESITGDIPSNFKRHMKQEVEAVEDEHFGGEVYSCPNGDVKTVVKCADYIEALLYLEEECAMGNTRLNDVIKDVYENFTMAWGKFDWNHELGQKPSATGMVDQFVEWSSVHYSPGLNYED